MVLIILKVDVNNKFCLNKCCLMVYLFIVLYLESCLEIVDGIFLIVISRKKL